MNTLSGFFLVWRTALVSALRGKRLIILILLAGLPVLVAVLVTSSSKHNVDATDFVVWTFLLIICQVTVPFGALFLGVAVLGDEIDGRTITFLFTRPLPRWVFYFGRLFGFACGFGLVVALSTLVCAQIYRSKVDITWGQVGATTAIALGGTLTYMTFFAALRALTRKAILVGFMITFILEFMLSKAPPGNGARLTVWHHLTLLMTRVFSGQIEIENGPLENLKDVVPVDSISGSIQVLIGVFFVGALVGAYVVKTREINVPAAVG